MNRNKITFLSAVADHFADAGKMVIVSFSGVSNHFPDVRNMVNEENNTGLD